MEVFPVGWGNLGILGEEYCWLSETERGLTGYRENRPCWFLLAAGFREPRLPCRLTRERKEVWKSGLGRRKTAFVYHADGPESRENPCKKNPFIPCRIQKPNRTFGQCMAFLSRGESEILIPGQ